jgi:uncharacterized protein
MSIAHDFSQLPPLVQAAVPDHSTAFSPELVLWREHMPGGLHWSGLLRRGNTLRIMVQGADANVSALFFNFDERSERYNMPDTLKAQETAYLRKGHVCYSDMGRILCSIPETTCAWHDTIGGLSDAALVAAKYGVKRFQEHRNAMHRNGRDGFLTQLGKWGLGKRDLVPNVNFFSRVTVDDDGALHFVPGNSKAGDLVDLRFEMNTVVVLSTSQHRLDPNTEYVPRAVEMTCWRSGTAGKDDICRHSRPENVRGFLNTERYFL